MFSIAGQNGDFRPISRFMSEMIQDRVIVIMERELKTQSFRMVPVSMILSDL